MCKMNENAKRSHFSVDRLKCTFSLMRNLNLINSASQTMFGMYVYLMLVFALGMFDVFVLEVFAEWSEFLHYLYKWIVLYGWKLGCRYISFCFYLLKIIDLLKEYLEQLLIWLLYTMSILIIRLAQQMSIDIFIIISIDSIISCFCIPSFNVCFSIVLTSNRHIIYTYQATYTTLILSLYPITFRSHVKAATVAF